MIEAITTGSHNLFAALRRRRSVPPVDALSARSVKELSIQLTSDTDADEVPLSKMNPGEFGYVSAHSGNPELKQHLLELGFTSGTLVEFVRRAPLADPLTVRIRGYLLSLRGREAEAIWIRRADSTPLDTLRNA